MAVFVLVHGAWHGARCWQKVVEIPTGHDAMISAPQALRNVLLTLA